MKSINFDLAMLIIRKSARSLFFVCGLFVMNSCADDVASFEVNLIYAGGDPQLIADVINSPNISVRLLFTYEGLNAVRVEPPQATAPRCDNCDPSLPEGVSLVSWEKAAGPGFQINEQGFVRVAGIPLRQRDLRLGIEFLKRTDLPIVIDDPDSGPITEYYAVARGCVFFSTDQPIGEKRLKERLRQGIEIYLGRTCGLCPPFEQGSRFKAGSAVDEQLLPINQSDFVNNAGELVQLDPQYLPPQCGEEN